MNKEWWIKNDEGWWFQAVEGFCFRTNELTDGQTFAIVESLSRLKSKQFQCNLIRHSPEFQKWVPTNWHRSALEMLSHLKNWAAAIFQFLLQRLCVLKYHGPLKYIQNLPICMAKFWSQLVNWGLRYWAASSYLFKTCFSHYSEAIAVFEVLI